MQIVAMDYAKHNEEAKAVWEAYRAGKPIRVPMVLGINPRFTMFDHPANPRNISFEQYRADPLTMMERQLEHQNFIRHNVPSDSEMGMPESWGVYVDFQNTYEAEWFGCQVFFDEGQVPDTKPILGDDDKRKLFDVGIPDPFEQPAMKDAWRFYEFFKEKEVEGYEFLGRPVRAAYPPGLGTDGPMTVACNLRGTTEFCMDLIEDPGYAEEMLDFVTEATIKRISAMREALGLPTKTEGYGWADDSVALLSAEMYKELILPRHRRLIDAFSSGGSNSIHLCGDATHLFPLIHDELQVRSFDTGFPVDFGDLRRKLGPDVEILGGPSIMLLKSGSVEDVEAETRRILNSGIREGGRFVLREGNNLAPGTPLENVWAMYETNRREGVYP